MIDKISDSEANLMLKYYERQEKIIKEKLKEALRKGNNQVALKKLYNQIQSANSQLKKYFKNYSQLKLNLIYDSSAERVEKEIRTFNAKYDADSSFNRLDERTIDILAKNTYKSLGTISTVIGRQSQDFLREIGLRQTQGIVFGTDSWQKVARDMTKELEQAGYFHIKYKNGTKMPTKAYCKMVARTTSKEAFRAGTKDRIKEMGFDLVIVLNKSSFPDSPCIPFQGKTLSMSGKTKGYIKESDAVKAGLFHPQCIHTLGFSPANRKFIK